MLRVFRRKEENAAFLSGKSYIPTATGALAHQHGDHNLLSWLLFEP